MQGAEERRLRRMEQYAASLSRASRSNERSDRRQRRRWCLDGGSGSPPQTDTEIGMVAALASQEHLSSSLSQDNPYLVGKVTFEDR